MTIGNKKSQSDVSSDSSWTLLNEQESASGRSSLGNVSLGIDEGGATKNILEKSDDEDPRQRNKGRKKHGIDYMSFLSVAACLLTITGITLLTTLLPPNYAESADIESLQRHLNDVYERVNNPSKENAAGSIQATIDALEASRIHDTLDIVSRDISEEEQTCDANDFSNYSLTPEDISELRLNIIVPFAKEMPKDEHNKTLIESAKDLVKSPTLQLFIATLVQDLCLIKLISEFSKRTKESASEEKESKQLVIKTPSKRVTKKKSKKSKIAHQVPSISSKNCGNCQSTSEVAADENGKSECQRRFEELDSKWSNLGQNHRQKIQKIKSKFQKEIFRINELEKESFNRKQKISFTREKFIQRLKADREVYIHRLRKLREERQRVLNNICGNFKNFRNLSSKDVCVGNFAVLLPSNYNFVKKLEEIRLKQSPDSHGKLEATNNEIISYIPPKDSTRAINKTQGGVRDVITNDLSKATSESLVEKASENTSDGDDFQLVSKKKTGKRDLNKLYDAAFEDQSKKIKQHDVAKWNKKPDDFKWPAAADLMPKQDPQKTHRQKIVYKGLL